MNQGSLSRKEGRGRVSGLSAGMLRKICLLLRGHLCDGGETGSSHRVGSILVAVSTAVGTNAEALRLCLHFCRNWTGMQAERARLDWHKPIYESWIGRNP